MIAQVSATTQWSIAPEVMLLASNKTIAAKVLTWATGYYGTSMGYMPYEIKRVEFKLDMFRFILGKEGEKERAIPLSAEQFIRHYHSIKAFEADMEAQDAQQAFDLENENEDEIEQEEIEQMRAAELEAYPQPQQRENPNTEWYRRLERMAAVKGYRVAPYDGLIRKAIVHTPTTKAYIQFTLVSDKWAVAFTFNGHPQVFETLGEAIAFIEANDTPQVLVEPWVFDKASSF